MKLPLKDPAALTDFYPKHLTVEPTATPDDGGVFPKLTIFPGNEVRIMGVEVTALSPAHHTVELRDGEVRMFFTVGKSGYYIVSMRAAPNLKTIEIADGMEVIETIESPTLGIQDYPLLSYLPKGMHFIKWTGKAFWFHSVTIDRLS